jgi:hypothetical protein
MNEWLNRKNKRKELDCKTLDQIDKVIKNWQETGEGSEKILTMLDTLANKVIDYLKPDGLEPRLKEEIHEEMVNGCIVRLRRVNTDKERSFNYFTTVMLAILRQITMTRKDMKKMKEKYREYLASRNSRN